MDNPLHISNNGSPEDGRRSRSSSNATNLHPTLSRESTDSTVTITPKDSWPSKLASQTSATTASTASSAAPSPLASREPSPTRPLSRTANSRASSANPGTRSRKNSHQDLSPSRTAPKQTIPSLPASSRTLSSANTPTLLPNVSDPNIAAPVPVKSPTTLEHLRESPRWPVSPRLRSPPPILNRPNLGQPRRGESEPSLPPLINLQRATPPQPQAPEPHSDTETDDYPPPGVRTPARGAGPSSSTLETVQEVSPLASPRGLGESMEEKMDDSFVSEVSQTECTEYPSKNIFGKANLMHESGSENGSVKADRRNGATSAPPLTSRQSSASVKPGTVKGKAGEVSLQNMTVETETVTSIPQVALTPGVGAQGTTGSLRAKPSTETIRPPKKDKKKPARKQPAVAAGTASSKADIFEAKVASAVEEANSSDSEETFVYDSNPHDGRDRPHRFHSRTPSATSMASQVDRNGMRSIHAVMESTVPSMAVKKSMKFVNSYNSNANESAVGEDDGKGTGRSNAAGSTRGTARHHHHFGRFGRGASGNGHPSLFTDPSPFSASQAAPNTTLRQPSGPPSPRFNTARGPVANGKRGMQHLSAGMDFEDTTTGADDERTPLISGGTARSGRSARSRRGMQPLRSMESQSYRRQPSFLNRFASCLVLAVMMVLVVSGAIGFMFATSQPLTEVTLVKMSHVVTSSQEMIFDLTFKAHNPNVMVVMVDAADIDVFAKSPHAGTDSEWWRHTHPGEIEPSRKSNRRGDIKALDDSPDDQPPGDSPPNMRLGAITGFDNALSFEGSWFHSGISYSTGEVRLKNPGNETIGGPERWERIVQDEFQLIVKGVIKYTLPLSPRVRSAKIDGKTTIKPNSANDPSLQPNTTRGDFSISA
ncbi:vacuolar segregation subunit 7-domain-containing protein [Podospora didyma]|uniref:Vacuolar segregation subunit 7-domain-containing protein n=1 Tax=Podospora didyma TaxID=330526 RepID=A0AAE0KKR7_9PEZI|nr:vacuolar segregation subunit 7-domain-containing protein [Podospora didyma]